MSNPDVQVRSVAALRAERGSIKQRLAHTEDEIRQTLATLASITAHCAEITARRYRALEACEADKDRNCSRERREYETAARVQTGVDRLAAELTTRLNGRALSIAERGRLMDGWLANLADHIDRVGAPPGDSQLSPAPSGGVGGGTTAGATSANSGETGAPPSRGGTNVIAGLALGDGVERVRLDGVSVREDLFEVEPAKGGASEGDMIWAAETFRDTVIPHAARGGTRDELAELDDAEGRAGSFRQRGGAWDVYLGSDMPQVAMSPDGTVVDVGSGRHRILAAKRAGLSWLPMRVHRLTEEQARAHRRS